MKRVMWVGHFVEVV